MKSIIIDKYRVLLIDGNNHYRNLFRLFARHAGILPSTAASGREAIALLRRFRMDCVVSEYDLPDLPIAGLVHALQHVEQLQVNRYTPIIAIAREILPTPSLRKLRESGVRAFYRKNDFLRNLQPAIGQAGVSQERFRPPASSAGALERVFRFAPPTSSAMR